MMAWLAGLLGLAAAASAGVTAQDKDRQVLDRFEQRIAQYMTLHRRLEKQSPPVKSADDPARIRASQKALAAKISAERKNAVPGAIFTPETRTLFRRRLGAQLDGPYGAEIRRALQADAPSVIQLRVHAEYPQGWPLSSVPPTILAVLPKIPEDLEYRFVRRDLILRDVHANLIVDFIRDAIR